MKTLFLYDLVLFGHPELLIHVQITHFSFKLFLDVQSLAEFVIAILEFETVSLVWLDFLVEFSFFTTKNAADLFAYDHQRFESFSYGRSDFSEHLVRKRLEFRRLLRLEQILPCFVSRHVETKTNSL
jgi:hypothetical protein